MKTISVYTIYCTPEQTRKALSLGAPIELESEYYQPTEHDVKLEPPIPCKSFTMGSHYAKCPTAEQMCGLLRKEKNINIAILRCQDGTYYNFYQRGLTTYFDTYDEATLAAIDEALECLTNNKIKKRK